MFGLGKLNFALVHIFKSRDVNVRRLQGLVNFQAHYGLNPSHKGFTWLCNLPEEIEILISEVDLSSKLDKNQRLRS